MKCYDHLPCHCILDVMSLFHTHKKSLIIPKKTTGYPLLLLCLKCAAIFHHTINNRLPQGSVVSMWSSHIPRNQQDITTTASVYMSHLNCGHRVMLFRCLILCNQLRLMHFKLICILYLNKPQIHVRSVP